MKVGKNNMEKNEGNLTIVSIIILNGFDISL